MLGDSFREQVEINSPSKALSSGRNEYLAV